MKNGNDIIIPIGIAEFCLLFGDFAKQKELNFIIHIVFHVKNGYLFAHCLETSVYSRINLKEIILKSNKNLFDLSNEIIEEIFRDILYGIVDHILNCKRNKIIFPFFLSFRVFLENVSCYENKEGQLYF